MRQALALDPGNFHHWMWLSHLYREAGDFAAARNSAREALNRLEEAPDPAISPEEQTRLVVRASLHAGDPDHAESAVRRLEDLRRNALQQCLDAPDFPGWRRADLFASPIFETLVELHGVLADTRFERTRSETPEENESNTETIYLRSLEHGLALAEAEGVSEEERDALKRRKAEIRHNLT